MLKLAFDIKIYIFSGNNLKNFCSPVVTSTETGSPNLLEKFAYVVIVYLVFGSSPGTVIGIFSDGPLHGIVCCESLR